MLMMTDIARGTQDGSSSLLDDLEEEWKPGMIGLEEGFSREGYDDICGHIYGTP